MENAQSYRAFAFAFYCPELHRTNSASTYAFSRLKKFGHSRNFQGESRIANILWRGDNFIGWSSDDPEGFKHRLDAVRKIVGTHYPGAEYRGIFTIENVLLIGEVNSLIPLPVVGPPVPLEKFKDGPMVRIEEELHSAANEDMPQKVVRLIRRPDTKSFEPR